MPNASQAAQAEHFRNLHRTPPALLLPNAWDAPSARLFQEAGFPAVATTSGGLAWSLGYGDGERAPWPEVVAATWRIARVLDIPLSADIESGYGDTATDVFDNVREIIDAGAVGINIEDGNPKSPGTLRSEDDAAERVRAARVAAERTGVPIVINARTDVFHSAGVADSERSAEALRRAAAYLAAGADCIFLFGHLDLAVAADLARQIKAPVNIVGRAGMPAMAALERLGIARVSTASGPALSALTAVHSIAQTLHQTRSFDHLTAGVKRADLQTWFSRP